jgi:hypothetical protein
VEGICKCSGFLIRYDPKLHDVPPLHLPGHVPGVREIAKAVGLDGV